MLKKLLLSLFLAFAVATAASAQNAGEKTIVQLWGGISTGSANTQAVTVPNLAGPLRAGYVVNFLPGFANTGATTLNVNGLGAKNIFKQGTTGPTALTGAELQTGSPGNLASVMYDGTQFQLVAGLSQVPSFGVVGSARQLTGSAAGAAKTASWTATELIAKTADGGSASLGANLSLSFNGGGTGAGGMDTGATPTSGDLYVYDIYNPGTATWNTLGTTTPDAGFNVYQGSHAVSGYTQSSLIWAGKTDGSGNIVAFAQNDRTVSIAQVNAFSGAAGTSNTYQTLSLSAIVPANARTVSGSFGAPAGFNAAMAIAANVSGLGEVVQIGFYSTSANSFESFQGAGPFGPLMMTTAQQIAWKSWDTGARNQIDISSYGF